MSTLCITNVLYKVSTINFSRLLNRSSVEGYANYFFHQFLTKDGAEMLRERVAKLDNFVLLNEKSALFVFRCSVSENFDILQIAFAQIDATNVRLECSHLVTFHPGAAARALPSYTLIPRFELKLHTFVECPSNESTQKVHVRLDWVVRRGFLEDSAVYRVREWTIDITEEGGWPLRGWPRVRSQYRAKMII